MPGRVTFRSVHRRRGWRRCTLATVLLMVMLGLPAGSAVAQSTLAIESSAPSIQIPDGKATISVTASADPTATGHLIGIWANGELVNGQLTGQPMVMCWARQCSYTATTGWAANRASGDQPPQTYRAQIGKYNYNTGWFYDVQAVSPTLTLPVIPVRSIGATLTTSAWSIAVPTGKATLTAAAGRDLSGTGYSIGIFNNDQVVDGRIEGQPYAICSGPDPCKMTVTAAATGGGTSRWRAQVGKYNYNNGWFYDVLGISGRVLVTSVAQPNTDNVSVPDGAAALAAAAPLLLDPCIELFPVAPPSQRTSLNQAQEACEAARAAGTPWLDVMTRMLQTYGRGLVIAGRVAAQDGGIAVGAPPRPSPPQPDAPPRGAPSPMPPPVDQSILDAGATNLSNRKLVTGYEFADDPQPDATARQVYAQCLRLAAYARSGITVGDCSTKAILVPGSDTPQAARHDFDVIVGSPDTFQLTYATQKEKSDSGLASGWYNNAPYRDVCGTGLRPIGSDGKAMECDEYPFYATLEGGPLPGQQLRPNQLRLLDSTDNGKAGRLYGGFAAVCGLVAAAPESTERKFLVVPLPDQQIVPTRGYCAAGYK